MTTNQRQLDFEEKCHKDAITKLELDITKAKKLGYFSSTLPAREAIKHTALELADQLIAMIAKFQSGRAVATLD